MPVHPARRFASFVAGFLLVVSSARAQSTYSSIIGTLADEQGAVLPGVAVTATNEGTGLVRSVVTNERGYYRVSNLPPGTYSVKAEIQGFATQERTGIVLAMGSEIPIDLKMAVAAVKESVTVTAQAPLVETTQKTVETTVSSYEVDTLPLKTRNFTDLALLAPGVGVDTTSANSNTDSISFGGFDERYKSMWLEGIDINDDVTRGGTTQSNASRHNFSQESIQEFQILANQYSAEFGRSGSGVMNILTRSGTNAYRGRTFYFLRDDAFDKKNALASGKIPFRTQQYGGTLGGPIKKDKIHFFATFERQQNDDVVTFAVPAFAIPMMKDPRTEAPRVYHTTNVFDKLTANLSSTNFLSINTLYERFMRTMQNNGGTVGADGGFGETGYSFFLNPTLTSVVGSNTSNQLRFAYSRVIHDRTPSGAVGPRVSVPGFSFGEATNYPQTRNQFNYIVMDTLTHHLNTKSGEHDLKTGFEINKSLGPRTINITFNGSFTFLRALTYDPANPTTWPTVFTISTGVPALMTSDELAEWLHRDLMLYGAFVEDQWRVLPNLTLSAGLRYDLQILGGDLHGTPLPDIPAEQFWQRMVIGDLKGINFQAYPNDKNNWAPRIGLAWSPRGGGRTVVRAGAGIFYDVIWTNDTGNVVQNYPGVFVFKYANDTRVTGIPNSTFPNLPALSTLSAQGSSSVQMPNPGALNPRTDQFSGGFQHQLTSNMAVSVDGIYSVGLHYPRDWNVNAIHADGTYPIEPKGTIMTVSDFGNLIHAKQVQVRLDRRSRDGLSYRAAYTWMNVKTYSASPVDNDNRNADWGPAPNDVRHRFVLSGGYLVPKIDVRVGGILTTSSAPPYNIISGVDTNKDRTTNDRPAGVDYNAGRGDSYVNVDLRASKLIRFGGRQVEVLWEMFNLFNKVNYGGFVGNMVATNFGKPTYALPPFQSQLGIRFDF